MLFLTKLSFNFYHLYDSLLVLSRATVLRVNYRLLKFLWCGHFYLLLRTGICVLNYVTF